MAHWYGKAGMQATKFRGRKTEVGAQERYKKQTPNAEHPMSKSDNKKVHQLF
jgi:hypothetical protein